jgi:hypothetical protein
MENISEKDQLDILMDSSKDADRQDASAELAEKLPDRIVLDHLDKMNRWKDKTGGYDEQPAHDELLDGEE